MRLCSFLIFRAELKWFAPLLLLCFLLPVTSVTVEAGFYPVIDHPLYGVRLGQHHPALAHDIRKEGKKVTRGLKMRNMLHSRGKVWTIKGSIDRNKSIDRTRFYLLGGQVYEIEVIFKNNSNRKYNQIREDLIDSYGEYEIDATGGALFFTRIDGQDVSIRLNRISVSDSGEFNITLQYFYERFVRDVRRLHKNRMSPSRPTNSASSR